MVQFNSKDNEILVKIVFYGPGLSGKTTNLQKLHEMMDPGQRTDLFSVNTMEDRTLFFDLLPLDLGFVYGNAIKLQIYTVPGQVHYDSTRRIVLSGADGVIFVADSDRSKMDENVQSINNLYHNLQANRLNIKEVPLVLQYNKRDVPNLAPIQLLEQKLNFRNVPYYEAVAIDGTGVMETFVAAVKQTVRYIFQKYQLSKGIKNADELLQKLEAALTSKVEAANAAAAANDPGVAKAQAAPAKDSSSRTVLKYTHNVNRDDQESQGQLLKKAITSNMETARLYTELKKTQEAVIKKNEELGILYKQLEKSNNDNLKMRRFLENLVNFAGEAIITFNDLWVVQNWNQAAEELFGYKRDQILNQNINILFPDEAMNNLNRVLSFVKQGKVVRGFETHLKNQSGDKIHVNLTFSPIKNKGDKIVAFTAIVRDLSFISQMYQHLHRLQHFEGVAGLMPHYFHQIESRMNGTDQDLLGSLNLMARMAKVSARKTQKTNLNEVVIQVRKLAQPLLQGNRVQWSEQLFPGMPSFESDPIQLAQLLLSLILNSVENFTADRTKNITLGTHFSHGEILLQFIDNGMGFSKEEMASLLDREVDQKRSTANLRLQLARDLATQNQGQLRVDSAPGKGTKVTLRFKQS